MATSVQPENRPPPPPPPPLPPQSGPINAGSNTGYVPAITGTAAGTGVPLNYYGAEVGVYGSAQSGTGVQGYSPSGIGVQGGSYSNTGVLGSSGSGTGTSGSSESGAGVSGSSDTGSGVYGTSQNFDGVHGESQSNEHAGVSGTNNSGGQAVWASSPNGVAIYGQGKVAAHFEGDVGIGTATPGSDVSMTGGLTINGTNATQMTVQQNGTSGFALNVSSGQWTMYDKVGGTWNPSITSKGGNVQFRDVEVTGTLNVDVGGDVVLKGSDFAEDFAVETGQSVEPGSVMVLDKNGVLRPCDDSYDRKVAGVISGAVTINRA
jgi:hypothetical protein